MKSITEITSKLTNTLIEKSKQANQATSQGSDNKHWFEDKDSWSEYWQKAKEELDEKAFKNRQDYSNIGRKFKKAFLANFETKTKEQKALYKLMTEYTQNFDKKTFQKWLVFLGNKGTGKTHTACTIANELIRKGVDVLYNSLALMLHEIKKSYRTGEDVLEEYFDVDFLILDEIAVVKLSEDDYRNFNLIIDHRYQNDLPTVLVSNAQESELFEFLGEKLTDRLNEVAKIIYFKGDSLRKSEGK